MPLRSTFSTCASRSLGMNSIARKLVTKTFNSNTTWTAPALTSVLQSLSGKGQDGAPSSTGTREDTAQVDSIQGYSSGSGNASGSLSWSDFEVDNANALSAVNGGGSGSFYGVNYNGYPGTGTYSISLSQGVYDDAVAGSASIVRAAGWKGSGPVVAGDYGFSLISYTQRYTIPAITGSSATGFSKTFPGGAGGPATVTNFANVPVTPLASYSIVVPPGGSITITYYE